jgi:PleD family two-component response regulator
MKILLVDDDPSMRASVGRLLRSTKHDVFEAEDGVSAMNLLDREEFNAVITDVQMPRGCGLDLLQHMWRSDNTPPTYVHSREDTFVFYGHIWKLHEDISKHFDFASFRIKGEKTMEDICAFVESIPVKA